MAAPINPFLSRSATKRITDIASYKTSSHGNSDMKLSGLECVEVFVLLSEQRNMLFDFLHCLFGSAIVFGKRFTSAK